MNKPSLVAYIVVEPREGSNKKPFWQKVGAAWPHKNGNGFDLVLPPGISVSGRIVCTQPKEESAEAQLGEETAAA